jgi:dCMP deaminase
MLCDMLENMDWNPQIVLIEGEKHREYLRQAYEYAGEQSHDPVTKTGAVLVWNDQMLIRGANQVPEGLDFDQVQLQNREWKYEHMLHAEVVAVCGAARQGIAVAGATMYMFWVPCTPCAKMMIAAGIKKLIGHKQLIVKTPERWWQNTEYALHWLREAGVEVAMYDGEIGGVQGMFDGEVWAP